MKKKYFNKVQTNNVFKPFKIIINVPIIKQKYLTIANHFYFIHKEGFSILNKNINIMFVISMCEYSLLYSISLLK